MINDVHNLCVRFFFLTFKMTLFFSKCVSSLYLLRKKFRYSRLKVISQKKKGVREKERKKLLKISALEQECLFFISLDSIYVFVNIHSKMYAYFSTFW